MSHFEISYKKIVVMADAFNWPLRKCNHSNLNEICTCFYFIKNKYDTSRAVQWWYYDWARMQIHNALSSQKRLCPTGERLIIEFYNTSIIIPYRKTHYTERQSMISPTMDIQSWKKRQSLENLRKYYLKKKCDVEKKRKNSMSNN